VGETKRGEGFKRSSGLGRTEKRKPSRKSQNFCVEHDAVQRGVKTENVRPARWLENKERDNFKTTESARGRGALPYCMHTGRPKPEMFMMAGENEKGEKTGKKRDARGIARYEILFSQMREVTRGFRGGAASESVVREEDMESGLLRDQRCGSGSCTPTEREETGGFRVKRGASVRNRSYFRRTNKSGWKLDKSGTSLAMGGVRGVREGLYQTFPFSKSTRRGGAISELTGN